MFQLSVTGYNCISSTQRVRIYVGLYIDQTKILCHFFIKFLIISNYLISVYLICIHNTHTHTKGKDKNHLFGTYIQCNITIQADRHCQFFQLIDCLSLGVLPKTPSYIRLPRPSPPRSETQCYRPDGQRGSGDRERQSSTVTSMLPPLLEFTLIAYKRRFMFEEARQSGKYSRQRSSSRLGDPSLVWSIDNAFGLRFQIMGVTFSTLGNLFLGRSVY